MTEQIPYDEFGYFEDNCSEFGIEWWGQPEVRRIPMAVSGGRELSGLKWGTAEPAFVLLHGGAQNAHTWDTVALALDRPLLAIDLPGHGHSGAPAAHATDVERNAADIAAVMEEQLSSPTILVGMSLGGLTSLALAAVSPELVSGLVLVDVTPGVTSRKASKIAEFVNGPKSFESFEALLQRTIEYNPTRSEASLRRGILHNAEQQSDGTWVWRHARHRVFEPDSSVPRHDWGRLWRAVEGFDKPLMLVRGMRDQSVVADEDEDELRRLCPQARIERMVEAGHSVQGDMPVEIAELLNDFSINVGRPV